MKALTDSRHTPPEDGNRQVLDAARLFREHAQFVANFVVRLGVRREGVTEGASKLQRAGLIRYSRGHITVLDRVGLESRSCECYAVVKKEYDRLLPAIAAR